jgi:aspartate aminotransferase
MKSILGHIGAWAPKPEQVGSYRYLEKPENAREFLHSFKAALQVRLDGFYTTFKKLKSEGLPLDAVAPQAAIYLTVNIDLTGKKLPEGKRINSVSDTTQYLLSEAGIALVPFTAFGAGETSTWYRLSVGTAKLDDIEIVENKLLEAINRLS